MSMKDILSKITEIQDTHGDSVVETTSGKKVLNESTDVTDYEGKKSGGNRKEALAKYTNSKDPKDAEAARKAGATQAELKKAKDEVSEMAKPSFKSVFTSMLNEAEQITIQPAQQNTQVIKQGDKTLGTVENPQLAQQIKQSIGKGEMTLASDDLNETEDSHDFFYLVFIDKHGGEENWIGEIYKDGSRWHEATLEGKPGYAWGSGTYMGYLEPVDIKSWMNRDYGRHYEIYGPYTDEDSALSIYEREAPAPDGWEEEMESVREGVSPEDDLNETEDDGLELYGLRIGDTVKATYLDRKGPRGPREREVQGDIIDIFPEEMEVELLLRGPDGGKTIRVDVRDTEYLDEGLNEDDPRIGNWYIKFNGKLIKNKEKNPVSFPNQSQAWSAAVKMSKQNDKPLGSFAITRNPTVSESKLNEKSVSKSQQQAAGAALAAKRGDAPKSKLKGASKEMAKMSTKELEKFAGTKHKGLPDKKKTNEAALPTHDSDFGAGLGAGRSQTTLESSTMRLVKQNKAGTRSYKIYRDTDWDEYRVKFYENGNHLTKADYHTDDKEDALDTAEYFLKQVKESTMKKTNEAKKAKPDFLDIDKDGNKKESMKKAAADKKKKTVKEGANPTESARLLGKAHAMANDTFSCKYEEGSAEALAYLDGYKEGLDECYGSGSSMGTDMMAPQQDVEFDTSFEEPFGSDMDDEMSVFDSPKQEPGMDMMTFEAWDRQLNELLNEGKMKDIDIDMKEMEAAEFKKEYGKTKAEMRKELSGTEPKSKKTVKEEVIDLYQVRYLPSNSDKYKIEKGFTSRSEAEKWIKGENLKNRAEDISIEKKTPVKEGISVSVSKGNQGQPDAVSVSAQDQDADALMAVLKQAGLGVFGGDDTSDYGSSSMQQDVVGDIGDHDSMMALMKTAGAGQDYADEETMDDEHVHGHPDAACDVCGESACECDTGYDQDKENLMSEEETEDQMEFDVSESDEESDEESDDEEELNEWANDAGYEGSENIEDNTFDQDIDFMTKFISGGLNKQKKDQTTLPHTKVEVELSESIDDWKKLSGIK